MADTERIPEVVMPFGAAMIAGVSTEAIRQAAAKGNLRTRAVLLISGRPTRLLDLETVRARWDCPAADVNTEIQHSVVIESYSGVRYRLVSPSIEGPALLDEPLHVKEYPGPGWPDWFRG